MPSGCALAAGGNALVFGRTGCAPFIPPTVRSRALHAWEDENDRRAKAADEGSEVELLAAISLHEGRTPARRRSRGRG